MNCFRILLAFVLLMFSRLLVAADIPMTQVLLQEVEPGLQPYTTRLLLNKRYLRMDEGDDNGDFVLFDRVTGEIHNFNHEEHSEVMIQRSAPVKLDVSVDFTTQQRILPDAPQIGGEDAVEHRYFADGELCKVSVNFKGLLPAVRQALIQYEQVIMQQNAKTFDAIQQQSKTPCYLANNYLYQSAYLKDGFPVHVVDNLGREKRLLDFAEVRKPAELFKQPEGYQVYYPSL
jgi:hypothetical protein